MTGYEAETRPVLLVVDDDLIMRKLVRRALEPLDCQEIIEVEDGLAARALLEQRHVDIVITDVMMPGLDGLELMGWATEHRPGPVWIILSGIESFANAVQAIQLGAADFISKPPQLERIQLSVRNVWRHEQLVRERERLDRALEQSHAELAERVTQLEQLCRLLEDQAEVIDQDLQRAELIQRALLPSAAPRLPGFCIDALYRPGRHVGGDLYDVVNLDERYTVLVIADASGHGVSAAMLSVLFKHRLEMSDADSGAPIRPPDALAAVNQALLADVPTPGVFVSAVYALLDKQTQEISLSSAGHPPVWWIRADHAPRAVERCGPALGLTRDVDYAETTLSLCSGDMLLFYTDGLLDDTKLDPKQVAEWYFGGGEDGYAVAQRLYEAARESSAGEDRDDITILLLQVREEQGRFDHAVDPERAPRATPTGVKLSCGECAEYTFFRIEGRGTWTDSQDFYEVARGVAESGRSLSIDLQDCVYLDSTFLGTIHELVTASVAAGGEPALQGIRPELRRLFEELCMDAVLARADAPERSAPVGLAPLERSADDLRRQQRVLRAHETLSSLSASNREQLEQVVQSLRAELRHGR